jgi:hypothetical protein
MNGDFAQVLGGRRAALEVESGLTFSRLFPAILTISRFVLTCSHYFLTSFSLILTSFSLGFRRMLLILKGGFVFFSLQARFFYLVTHTDSARLASDSADSAGLTSDSARIQL